MGIKGNNQIKLMDRGKKKNPIIIVNNKEIIQEDYIPEVTKFEFFSKEIIEMPLGSVKQINKIYNEWVNPENKKIHTNDFDKNILKATDPERIKKAQAGIVGNVYVFENYDLDEIDYDWLRDAIFDTIKEVSKNTNRTFPMTVNLMGGKNADLRVNFGRYEITIGIFSAGNTIELQIKEKRGNWMERLAGLEYRKNSEPTLFIDQYHFNEKVKQKLLYTFAHGVYTDIDFFRNLLKLAGGLPQDAPNMLD